MKDALRSAERKQWKEAREQLLEALNIESEFIPALLLIRAVRRISPSIFKTTDISEESALERAKKIEGKKKEESGIFVKSLASPKSTSWQNLLVGLWQDFIEKNFAQAVHWYQLSADQGYSTAQNNLGRCFQNGIGVEKNFAQAFHWYQLSADQGYSWAQESLKRLGIK